MALIFTFLLWDIQGILAEKNKTLHRLLKRLCVLSQTHSSPFLIIYMPVLSLTTLLCLSFLICKTGKNNTCFIGLLWGVNELISRKCVAYIATLDLTGHCQIILQRCVDFTPAGSLWRISAAPHPHQHWY